MGLHQVRLLATLHLRAERLFEDGYRAGWIDEDTVAVISVRGETYQIDRVWQTCTCPYYEQTGGRHGCKHLLGYERLLARQHEYETREHDDERTDTVADDTTDKAQRPKPLFPLGMTAITVRAAAALLARGMNANTLLDRHERGDWGDIDDEDKASNNQALVWGGRLISTYRIGDGREVWVITEANRSLTTILMPEDY